MMKYNKGNNAGNREGAGNSIGGFSARPVLDFIGTRQLGLAVCLSIAAASSAWGTDNCDGNSGTYAGVSLVCGSGNTASGANSTAVGINNTASGDFSTAVGNYSTASGTYSVTLGDFSTASGIAAIALGDGSQALGDRSAALGSGSKVEAGANDSTAIGASATVNAGVTSAVALGADAVATESNTVSVGAAGAEKRIVNVAAGTAATDAVNKGQLDTAQTTANTALGTANTALSAAGAAQATANAALGGIANSTQYSDAGQTLGLNDNGGTGTRVANVAAGAAAMDAVNFSQLQAVMTQLIESGVCRVSGASVSCGAAATDAVQMGSGATVAAGADNAVAIGHNANAQSVGGVAVGDGATAAMANSVAIGKGATAHSSVAVGTNAQALGNNTTALGDNALASGNVSVALGNNAQALHNNAVALGNGSVTSADNTVSVGAAGAERRITNVAAPVGADDAATKGYVDSAIANSGAAVANAYTDREISAVRKYAAQGIAATAAIMNVTPSVVGKTALGIGSGYYDGQAAIGISLAHAPRAGMLLSGGIAASNGGKPVARAGVAFEF